MPLFLMRPTAESKITQDRKLWNHEIRTRKNLGPPKYKKKIGTLEVRTRKYFVPTKYPREKVLDPRNTHEGTMAR